MVWTAREERHMVVADELSKRADNTSWSLSPPYYEWMLQQFGLQESDIVIDPFSDETNHRGPVWFSRYIIPGSSGVDGFSQKWVDTRSGSPVRALAFVHGPFSWMDKIIRKIREEQCDCILITPGPQADWVAQLRRLPVVKSVVLPQRLALHPGVKKIVAGARVAPGEVTSSQMDYLPTWAHLVRWPQ